MSLPLLTNHSALFNSSPFFPALRSGHRHFQRPSPQVILQLNKAWMADLSDEDDVLAAHPAPYQALVWLLETAAAGNHGYLGNPVRHFQHLASRVSGPRSEIRAWRAWLCFHLAEKGLPAARFPRDGH
jgi:hypothetical protein